ncbi:MAG: hypothetical protein HN417_10050 [Desulfobacula sp.]|nr:hypothetical protein [Desulfobacula sp.]
MTTIESYKIIDYLIKEDKLQLLSGLSTSQKRFLPKITINQFAELCINDGEIPEEENNPDWGNCAFLSDDICSIYELRPFACRCMLSEKQCGEKGYAFMNPFILTVNNVFQQYIEHLDQNGYFGNIADILTLLSDSETRADYMKNNLKSDSAPLISNKKIKYLMIPPEDRAKIAPLLNKLNNLL